MSRKSYDRMSPEVRKILIDKTMEGLEKTWKAK